MQHQHLTNQGVNKMTFQLNQRVNTIKYGEGVIVDFEVCHAGYAKCLHLDNYVEGARIGIKLDKPENWSLHSASSGVPYFVPSDIKGD
jgi:hypothetical protein